MKGVKFLLVFLVLFITFLKVDCQTFPVIPLFHYCVNGTAIIVYLEEYKDEYLYFADDFYDGCNDEKDVIKYYEFISGVDNIINSKSLLNYAMIKSNNSSYYLKKEDIVNLDWKPINQINPPLKENRWFYEVKKEDDKNIVLFRLAKNGNKKGEVSMETLPEKPDFDDYELKNETETEKDKDEETDKKTDRIIRINSSNYLAKITYMLLIILILF